MDKRFILFLAVAAIAACSWLIASGFADQPKPNDVGALMKLKLKHSQSILAGVAVEDFDLIAKNSQQLALLAQDANWRVFQTPEYRHHSADFQRIADNLTKAAKDRNGDAAALAYVQLTMSCVNCHKYVRGVRMASAR